MPNFIRGKDGRQTFLPKVSLSDEYEFRVAGVLGTRFLVRVINEPFKIPTLNTYGVDLADPAAVAGPATEDEWSSGAIVPLRDRAPREVFARYAESRGFHFTGSGDHNLSVGRVSTDRSIVIAQSWSGTMGSGGGSDVPGDFSIHLDFSRSHGKIFFDVYSVDTGKKLITITTTFRDIIPDNMFEKTGWVTERYFFVPLDERREKCLTCDFGRRNNR